MYSLFFCGVYTTYMVNRRQCFASFGEQQVSRAYKGSLGKAIPTGLARHGHCSSPMKDNCGGHKYRKIFLALFYSLCKLCSSRCCAKFFYPILSALGICCCQENLTSSGLYSKYIARLARYYYGIGFTLYYRLFQCKQL